MSPWLFNVYMNRVMEEVKRGIGRIGVIFSEEGEGRVSDFLYADDLA